MPPRTKTRKPRRRTNKSRKLKAKSSVARSRLTRGPTGFPDSISLKLKWVESHNRSLASGISAYVIRGNGPYDPRYAVGGTQPYGWDEWTAFYSKYLVTSSKIKVTMGETSTGTVPLIVTLAPRITDTTDSDVNLNQQRPYTRKCILAPAGNAIRTCSHYISTKKILGLRHVDPEENVYSSDITGLPAQEWFWHITSYPQDGTSNVAANFTVEIVYYITFFKRQALSAS